MRKISRYLKRLVSPRYMQDIDLADLLRAMNDETVRRIWLYEVYQELRNLNLGVEKALMGGDISISRISARRRAFQDVLEMILNARTRRLEERDPNPRFESEVDLDRVTV